MIGGREHDARYEPPVDPVSDLHRLVELWRAKYGADWVQDWYIEKGRVPVKLRLVAKPQAERG